MVLSRYAVNSGDYSFVWTPSQNELKVCYSKIGAYQGDTNVLKIYYEHQEAPEDIFEI